MKKKLCGLLTMSAACLYLIASFTGCSEPVEAPQPETSPEIAFLEQLGFTGVTEDDNHYIVHNGSGLIEKDKVNELEPATRGYWYGESNKVNYSPREITVKHNNAFPSNMINGLNKAIQDWNSLQYSWFTFKVVTTGSADIEIQYTQNWTGKDPANLSVYSIPVSGRPGSTIQINSTHPGYNTSSVDVWAGNMIYALCGCLGYAAFQDAPNIIPFSPFLSGPHTEFMYRGKWLEPWTGFTQSDKDLIVWLYPWNGHLSQPKWDVTPNGGNPTANNDFYVITNHLQMEPIALYLTNPDKTGTNASLIAYKNDIATNPNRFKCVINKAGNYALCVQYETGFYWYNITVAP